MQRRTTPETPAVQAPADIAVTTETETETATASAATLEVAAEVGTLRWFKLLSGPYPIVLPYAPYTRIEPGEEHELRETPFLMMQVDARIMSVHD
jgi:hypothetical protein